MSDPQSEIDADLQAALPLVPALRGRALTIKPLGGGLTNRNYRVDAGDEAYVVRIAGANSEQLGIDRVREVAAAQAAAEAGIGPGLIAYLPEQHVLVTRFLHGRQLTLEEARQPAMMRRVAQALRAYHDHPISETLGEFSPFAAIRSYYHLARARNVTMPADLDQALMTLDEIERELRGQELLCLCHNDLLLGNFINTGDALRILDWEYAGRGDRFFDLGNFAAHNQLSRGDEALLLEGYFGSAGAEQLRRLQRMRLVSDLREATWGFLQSSISRLYTPQHYLDYGLKFLRRFQSAAGGPA